VVCFTPIKTIQQTVRIKPVTTGETIMTRKHFEAIASALLEARKMVGTRLECDGVDTAIRQISQVCASFNGQFDSDRFERACGL
jgi:hypothetical protein